MRPSSHSTQRCQEAVNGGASLSVVLVMSGSTAEAQRATTAVRRAATGCSAQLILVSRCQDATFATSVERSGAEFVVAPPGSTRAQMCDLGVSRARGTILAVRDDVTVGNASWIDAYRTVLSSQRVKTPRTHVEAVVMDTSVPATRRDGRADARPAYSTREGRATSPSMQTGAAI